MYNNIVYSLFLVNEWLKYDQHLIRGWLVLKGLQVYHVYNAAQGLMLEILFVMDREWYNYKKTSTVGRFNYSTLLLFKFYKHDLESCFNNIHYLDLMLNQEYVSFATYQSTFTMLDNGIQYLALEILMCWIIYDKLLFDNI